MKKDSQHYIQLEHQYSAQNYHPLPVVLSRGDNFHLFDVEGKQYLDFLSAYSAVNQGHNHPKILNTLVDQAQKLSLVSRAFHSDQFGEYAQFICQFFAYDQVLPMNTGAEAVETAIKLCRKWGYQKKGIPINQSKIIFVRENFHGRTLGVISASIDPDSTKDYGPFLPGYQIIPYNDIDSLAKVIQDPHIAGFIVEPIQGEAGVKVPDNQYITKAYELCRAHQVLFIADEIQTGLGRTGKMLACDYESIKPDILILGKALSGGMYPVSAVLSNQTIMECIRPGEHGSTYGGNPLACAIAKTALSVLKEEKLIDNAYERGKQFRSNLQSIQHKYPIMKEIRGKGLLNALEIKDEKDSKTAWQICLQLADKGLLAKPTHGNIIRFSPPLTIDTTHIDLSCQIIEEVIQKF